MQYIIEHTVMKFTWWDIPALLVFIGVIVLYLYKNHKAKQEENRLEEQLAAYYANDVSEVTE